MKRLKLGGIARLIALVVGVNSPPVDAQACKLDPGGCGAITCSGGCIVSFAIQHSNFGYFGNGAFDLVGTEFETTCNGNLMSSVMGCPQLMPPVRFWAYDNYDAANSGCFDGLAGQWMASGPLDLQLAQPDGKWYLYQTNWGGPPPSFFTIDGCVAGAGTPETVVEISWTDTQSGNLTTDHDSWYIAAAVADPYDFDKITGGDTAAPPFNGGVPAEILPQLVPDITGASSAAGTATCPRGAALTGDPNADANFIDVDVTSLSNSMPDYFTEMGRNAGSQLIAGVQIMMLIGSEPTSSEQTAGWAPARDPAAPTTNVAGIWAWGGAGPVTVAIGPIAMGQAWLASRIVYQDASLNGQVGAGPDATAPQVVSLSGKHCGPFVAGVAPPAVTFDRVEAVRTGEGIDVKWTTLYEDDIFGYKIFRAENPGMEAAVEAVSWIDSSGLSTGGSYAATDFAVAGNTEATYYYYVQEVTSNGLGNKSPIVEVQGFGFENDPTGGRRRTSSRR